MWDLFHLSFRVLLGVVGLCFLLMALFLYPSEEGRMQSVLEDLWTRIDDRQKSALSRHTAFMQEVAKLETRYLDLLFGHKLFSIRSVGASLSYSLASVALVATVALLVYAESHRSLLFLLGSIIFVGFLFIGSVPTIFPKFRLLNLWFLFIFVFTGALLFGIFVITGDYAMPVQGELGLKMPLPLYLRLDELFLWALFPMAASTSCDILFIAATRKLLRWAGEMKQFFKIGALLALNYVLAIALVYLPVLLPIRNGEFVMASNTIDVLFAWLFVLLAALLLAHRLFWPLLNRSVFRIQEIGAKGRRAVLISIGLALLGTATNPTIVERIKKVTEMFKG